MRKSWIGRQWIYFILAPRANCVKIGIAHSPQKRLALFQTGSPEKLELLCTLESDTRYGVGTIAVTEEHLHKKFWRHRVHGEWFYYHQEIQDWIVARCNTRSEFMCKKGEEQIWYKMMALRNLGVLENFVKGSYL